MHRESKSSSSCGQPSAVMRKPARSFDLAARLLSPPARAEIALLCAFARNAHDLADEPAPGSLDERLARLAAQKADVLSQRPADPLAAAVANIRVRQALPAHVFGAFLDSLMADAHPRTLATEAELLAFAYGVAGTVGLMMRPILGATPAANGCATALGIAMQLTNIARDVVEDAGRSRCYVPLEYGVAMSELSAPADTAARERAFGAIKRLLALAEHFYDEGASGLMYIPARNRRAISIALVLYRGIGRKILARGPEHYWHGRAHLAALEKVWLIARHGWRALTRTDARINSFNTARNTLPASALQRLGTVTGVLG